MPIALAVEIQGKKIILFFQFQDVLVCDRMSELEYLISSSLSNYIINFESS